MKVEVKANSDDFPRVLITVLTERYSCWREAKDIPVEEKSKCDWHKLLLEQVFPSFSIGYFLRQVTRTDQNAR